jgi:hypothetical protein
VWCRDKLNVQFSMENKKNRGEVFILLFHSTCTIYLNCILMDQSYFFFDTVPKSGGSSLFERLPN